MRARRWVTLAAWCMSMYLWRYHIQELAETARLFSTFKTALRHQPSLIHPYPAPDAFLSKSATSLSVQSPTPPIHVPRIIHQIALGNANLTKHAQAIQSCREAHPDWQHVLWTDETATEFLAANYPDILPHWLSYFQDIQRANILRYAVLHTFGGVYLDLDVTCLISLDETDIVTLPWVTPAAFPAGINNAFIATQPGHPLLTQVLAHVPSHNLRWTLPLRIPYVENMLSTGCLYISLEWFRYVKDLAKKGENVSEAEKVYILGDQELNVDPHMLRGKIITPLFAHGGASSWHSWDAAVAIFLSRHYVLVGTLVVGCLALAHGVAAALRSGLLGKHIGTGVRGRHGASGRTGMDRASRVPWRAKSMPYYSAV